MRRQSIGITGRSLHGAWFANVLWVCGFIAACGPAASSPDSDGGNDDAVVGDDSGEADLGVIVDAEVQDAGADALISDASVSDDLGVADSGRPVRDPAIGGPCLRDADCGSAGHCFAERGADSSYTGFPGGLCALGVASCGGALLCPDDTVCVHAGSVYACVDACVTSADCRDGYHCDVDHSCWPGCNDTRACPSDYGCTIENGTWDFCAPSVTHSSTPWNIERVYGGTDTGAFIDVRASSDANIHAAWYEDGSRNLVHTSWNGSVWTKEYVDSEGDVGSYASLALSSTGEPRIAYFDETNSALKYASWNGTTWHVETVASGGDVGRWAALALDEMDHPCIAYYDSDSMDLRFARKVGGVWSTGVVDSVGDVGAHSAIAIAAGQIQIAYYDQTNRDLKVARALTTGALTWSIATVDSGGDVGKYSSIAARGTSTYIAYYDATNADLKLATSTPGGWNLETVANAGNVGAYGAIALSPSMDVSILYLNASSGEAELATRASGGTWTTSTRAGLTNSHYLSVSYDSTGDLWFASQHGADPSFVDVMNLARTRTQHDLVSNVNASELSMVVDALGVPHIAVRGAKVFSRSEEAWTSTQLPLDHSPAIAQISLALDGSGILNAAVNDAGTLKLARRVTGTWESTTTTLTNLGSVPSISFDGDTTYVAYDGDLSDDVSVGIFDGVSWDVHRLSSHGYSPQVLVAGDGSPRVLWHGSSGLTLAGFATRDGAAWPTRELDLRLTSGHQGMFVTDAGETYGFTTLGTSAVFFHVTTDGTDAELVDSRLPVGLSGAMHHSSSGVHVTYVVAGSGVYYALGDGSGWHPELVEALDLPELIETANAVAPDGTVHVAYVGADGVLRHAWR